MLATTVCTFNVDCEQDKTDYSNPSGTCFEQDDYELSYQDDGGEYLDVEDALQDVGCTGGHEVCADECIYQPARPVHAQHPVFQTDGYDYCPQGGYEDGYVYWLEYSEDWSQGPFCDDPTDLCYNDVNTDDWVGESTEWGFDCDCVEESIANVPAGSPGKAVQP